MSQSEQVECPECGDEMDARGFNSHMRNKHGFEDATKDDAVELTNDAETAEVEVVGRDRDRGGSGIAEVMGEQIPERVFDDASICVFESEDGRLVVFEEMGG
jgi:hypothetical protein